MEETPGPRGELKPEGPQAQEAQGRRLQQPRGRHRGEGRDQGLQAVQQGLGKSLPVLYPTKRLSGSLFAGPPRVYKLKTRTGAPLRAATGW